ncbi:MAG: fibro-slime domain-containing protein [Fibromonadaceae bacterium]|jgi:fibro-slime domain-containing protein|nr:fibro-slime domain-containing protein [Fibromonadaceae bacterium]
MKNSVCLKGILVILALGYQTLFAQRVTFYFLPPASDTWVAGNSYIYDGDKKTVELMQVDSRCGWFKKVYNSVDDVPEKAMIYLGSQGKERLDSEGTGADDPNDPNGKPNWIGLRARFGTNTALYFYQDPTSGDLDFRYRTTAPGNLGEEAANRCSYKMAAFIYDTDSSVNPSFRGNYRQPTENGLRRGIVASTLDTTDGKRKPKFIATPGRANWVNDSAFNAAFTPKGIFRGKVSNIPRCYDMPFSRATNGTWQFDSDSLRTPTTGANAGRNLVGGFFPYILDQRTEEDGSQVDYSDCELCDKKYQASCFNTISNTNVGNIPALTYKEETYRGIEAFNRANDRLAEGWSNTAPYNAYSQTAGCDSIRPGFDGAKKRNANLSFCFESHAQFTYEKGQEFFFRGDDDIWIFINNQLVIDLGGVHQAAPAFVDLDTIKTPEVLVAGKTYPIDIFFCERMATQSNVRVSTNMYIVQKTSFYPSPDRYENWMCASISTGNDCASKMNATNTASRIDLCGDALIDSSAYTVDFYMVNNRDVKDTVWLSGTKNNKCTGTATQFACFEQDGLDGSGITVKKAIYSCGGRGKCKGDDNARKRVDAPPGNWTVYSRLIDVASGKPVVGSQPLNIDYIKGEVNARIIWGELVSEHGNSDYLYDSYDDITKMNQAVIAGKRTPIYVATGRWVDTKYNKFEYTELETNETIEYSLSGVDGLKVTLDSLGETLANFPRLIPQGGVDTVWVEGSFEMGEQKFEINLKGITPSEETPSLKLTIYQPRLRFTTTDNSSTFVTPSSPSTASGFRRWVADSLPPYKGNALDVYVVAWDTLRSELCSHCNFVIKETSTTNNDKINNDWKDGIVLGEPLRIKNGRQTIYIRGQDVVEGTDFAKWRITGPSKEFTFAEWTNLQFRDAPVPMPRESFIYDRNGDGIGDSLIIKYAKPFKTKGKIIDSLLPVLIEITWEKGYTIAYHHPKHKLEDLKKKDYVMSMYKSAFFEENREYWEKYINGDSSIIITDTVFSKNILTYGYNSGNGRLSSYTPFYDQNKCISGSKCPANAFMWRDDGYEATVFDGVSPIVVRAVYKMDRNRKCGDNSNHVCEESLVAYLSEPIYAAPNSSNDPLLIKNPFSYCFEYSQLSKCSGGKEIDRHDQEKSNTTGWKWELPQDSSDADTSYSVTYRPNKKSYPKEYYNGVIKGDSIVDLTYWSYNTTRMPKATDWIKIRWPSSSPKKGGVDVFYDASGNTANPREIGVLISGTNYYKKEQVKISPIVAHPDSAVLNGLFSDGSQKRRASWLSSEARGYANDNLFQPGDVTAFLPVPKGYTIEKTKVDYRGSVGTIFDIADNINNEVNDILAECNGNCKIRTQEGREVPLTAENIAEGITLHASAYYHTNLGNYTAHRTPVVANCTDKIFRKSDGPDNSTNNCYSNRYNFYLAWDLKTNKNRFVGTGAYVAITKFYWQIEYIDEDGNTNSPKFNQDEFVEMFGVRRGN